MNHAAPGDTPLRIALALVIILTFFEAIKLLITGRL